MLNKLRERLQGGGGHFIRSSLLLAVGFAVARVLGLAFSLLLGRALPTDEFGYIQYSILLSGIFAIGTMPFMQHTFARFLSISRTDERKRDEVFSTAVAILGGIIVLTLLFIGLFSVISQNFNPGAFIIFLCISLYYGYYGLARGFEDSKRLSTVFIASNFIQFIAILVTYYLLHERATFPALAIYGLSYVGPVLFLTFFYPIAPLRFRFADVKRTVAAELLRFSGPVWVSHALFAFTTSGDVFILTTLAGEAAAGAFVFTRTLGLTFDFLPVAISTLIMPRVASSASSPRRLLLLSMGIVLAVNVVLSVIFLVMYPWFIVTFIQPDYLLPMATVVVIILAQVAFGLHGVVTGVVVGQSRTGVELISRLIIVVCLYTACYALIPSQGIMGAALANLIAAVGGLLSYPLLIELFRRRAPVPVQA
jgi:O-antigen/teichoic acid export membrane protein